MWLSESNLCPEWFKLRTNLDAVSCTITDPEVKGGQSGANLIKLFVTLADGKTLKVVLKTALGEAQQASKMYGTVREAKVYEMFKTPEFRPLA